MTSSNVYTSAKIRVTIDQTTPATTWAINHNIGTLYPVVDVYVLESGTYTRYYSAGISVVDANNVNVTFSQPTSGYVTVM
jgi:hypothetical protein